MTRYILYARKSTDEEDRQVLSIEAQLAELQEFAAKEKLEIVASLCEAKTAKEPGRTKFGEMLDMIEKGIAEGILAWHPDRLARNPIDGGKVIYLVDTGKITHLKFPSFWFEDTPQGKFMLNIAFGQSKYFVDNLSENVKRGIRQKLRRGEWPGWAPLGYLNDLRTHTIVIDKNKHKLIKRIFELYATGDFPFKTLADTANDLGLVSQKGKQMCASMLQHILQNPFYYGVFRLNGEIYEATHEPIITKKLFEKCLEVMRERGRPHKLKVHNYIFTGLIKCGSCGCMVTAETQKGHVYYRCTKKKGICHEKYIREEALADIFKKTIQKVSLPDDWTEKFLGKLEEIKLTENQSSESLVQNLKHQVEIIDKKLDVLLDTRLEQVIEKSEYLQKKEQLISQKMTIAEKIKQVLNKGNNWLEPMKEMILQVAKAKKIAISGDFSQYRSFLKIIGSNFILKGNLFNFEAETGWRALVEREHHTNWLPGLDSNQQPSP